MIYAGFNEYNTTKVCSLYGMEMVNAGLNILKIGYQHFVVGDIN